MQDANSTLTLQTMPDDILSLTFSYFSDYKSWLDMRATSRRFHTPPPSICKTISQALEEFKKQVPSQSLEELKKNPISYL